VEEATGIPCVAVKCVIYGGTPAAKAGSWANTDAEARKRGGKRQPSSKQPPAIIQIKENSVMSTLFTAVSVEQQEIVAGGAIVVVPDNTGREIINYGVNQTMVTSENFAGLQGTWSKTTYANNNVTSNLDKSFTLTYFAYPV